MMQKLKVLIPTDFTVQSEYAYLLVKRLEVKVEIEIHFLHVLQVPDTVTLSGKGVIETCGEIDVNFVKAKKEIADRKLANLKSLYGNSVYTHLILGKPTDGIVSFAEQNNFDVIAMGTKGAWGLKERISGSETQMIARQSKVPLLSMMCDRSELTIKNILLVHNFSNPKTESISFLKLLMNAFNPQIHFLEIVTKNSNRDQIQKNMDQFGELNQITNFEKHLLNDSDVESGVIHFNQMHEMDVVCIGRHGRTGIDKIIHPSATEKLINHLFKPILSFHLSQ